MQNLLVYRFANSIMEPLWNRNYIDHIQISVAETLGIEYRAKYYENSGALRDMIQSHLMQLMTLVAMEPPVEFTADAVRDEKMKVLRALRRFEPQDVGRQAVAAQYASGHVHGEDVAAYVSEEGVSPESATETFSYVAVDQNVQTVDLEVHINFAGEEVVADYRDDFVPSAASTGDPADFRDAMAAGVRRHSAGGHSGGDHALPGYGAYSPRVNADAAGRYRINTYCVAIGTCQ